LLLLWLLVLLEGPCAADSAGASGRDTIEQVSCLLLLQETHVTLAAYITTVCKACRGQAK
jgi:hypothetical protein